MLIQFIYQSGQYQDSNVIQGWLMTFSNPAAMQADIVYNFLAHYVSHFQFLLSRLREDCSANVFGYSRRQF